MSGSVVKAVVPFGTAVVGMVVADGIGLALGITIAKLLTKNEPAETP